jgi:predicted dinucleotide-binding enzyme
VPDALKADVVILAVPFTAIGEAVGGAAAWNGRIVVDATNAINFPAFTPTDLGGRPSTAIVAELVPGARVVKAFNTLPAAVLASDPTQDSGRRVLFVSGNDATANADIAGLIERLGFAPITLGTLAEGGLLQQFGAPLVAQNLTKHA